MTTVDPATFQGADVAGLRSNANGMTKAAGVCDDVKAACQAIVAVSFFLGPFGAAFVHYLETEVIPWLTKISTALNALSKALTSHADAQDDASSPASLTSSGPTRSTTTTNPGTTTTSPATSVIPGSDTSTVGLLQIPVNVAPDGTITPLLTTASLGTDPSVTTPTTDSATTDPTIPTATADLGSTHHLTNPSPTGGGTGTGTGSGTGGGAGGGTGGGPTPTGYTATAPTIDGATIPTSTVRTGDGQLAAQLADATRGGRPELQAARLPGASHDGLFTGLGQATGIGAGAAALARAVVVEARRAAIAPPVIGMPADAQSDRLPQAQIFDGALG